MDSEATRQPASSGSIAFQAWFEVNKKRVAIGVALAIVVFLFGALYLQQQSQKERRASQAYSDARVPWNTAVVASNDVLEALAKVASDYRGTKAASRALLTSAGLLYSDRKFAEAEAMFAQVTKQYPDSQWAPEATLGVAASLDAQGKTTEAMAKYEEIKRRFEKSAIIDDAKLALARLYENQKPEDAYKMYEELTKTMPGSRVSMEATMRQEDLLKARPELAKLKESLNPPPAPPAASPVSAQPQLLQLSNQIKAAISNAASSAPNRPAGTSQPVQIKLSPGPSATPGPAPAPAPAK